MMRWVPAVGNAIGEPMISSKEIQQPHLKATAEADPLALRKDDSKKEGIGTLEIRR